MASQSSPHDRPAGVILAARWTTYIARPNRAVSEPWVGQLDVSAVTSEEAVKLLESKLRDRIQLLLRHGIKTLLVLSPPELRYMPSKCFARLSGDKCGVTLREHLEHQRPIRELFECLIQIDPGMIRLYDPTSFFCDQNTCYAQRAGQIPYMDSNHISEPARVPLAEDLRGALQWLISRD